MTLLLPATTITTAIATQVGTTFKFREPIARNLTLQFVFTYGSSGTSVDAYVQTTFDGGTTWVDIANFHVTTSSLTNLYNLSSLTPKTSAVVPTDGSLTANTAIDGLIGDWLRVKYKSSGTYAGGTTLQVGAFGGRMQT